MNLLLIVIVIFGIMISIVLHEFGHFLPARLFGVPCPQFSVGFGPKIFSKYWNGTLWSVKWIWLGGSTEISGPFPPNQKYQKNFKGQAGEIIVAARDQSLKTIPEGEKSKAMYWLSAPKKLLIMAGGILMNLLLGMICFFTAFSALGYPDPDSGERVHATFSQVFKLIGIQLQGTLEGLIALPVGFYNSVLSLFNNTPRSEDSMVSIFGFGSAAVEFAGQSESFIQGAYILFILFGSLNFGLFILNLIPVMPLDGGQVVNAIYEGIKRTVLKIRFLFFTKTAPPRVLNDLINRYLSDNLQIPNSEQENLEAEFLTDINDLFNLEMSEPATESFGGYLELRNNITQLPLAQRLKIFKNFNRTQKNLLIGYLPADLARLQPLSSFLFIALMLIGLLLVVVDIFNPIEF